LAIYWLDVIRLLADQDARVKQEGYQLFARILDAVPTLPLNLPTKIASFKLSEKFKDTMPPPTISSKLAAYMAANFLLSKLFPVAKEIDQQRDSSANREGEWKQRADSQITISILINSSS